MAGMKNKFVVAIDSFKGCLTSQEANQAAAEGIGRVYPAAEVIQIPVSDGGEGFIDAFRSAIGGDIQELTVNDPLMRPVAARYLLKDSTAVIEIAQASGLPLLSKEGRDPLVATSYGTGELVADAVRKGAERVIVGLGGSATSDAGVGMLRALVDAFAENGTWEDITELKGVRFMIASDVRNPLCGENGAACVFGPARIRKRCGSWMRGRGGLPRSRPSISATTARKWKVQAPPADWATPSCSI